jgi:hypothetical protein
VGLLIGPDVGLLVGPEVGPLVGPKVWPLVLEKGPGTPSGWTLLQFH